MPSLISLLSPAADFIERQEPKPVSNLTLVPVYQTACLAAGMQNYMHAFMPVSV
jgi:hypothetical protein